MRLLLPLLLLSAAAPLLTAQDLYDEATVRDIELSFTQPNWWNDLYTAMQSETYVQADMVVDGVTYPAVGVRFKGNSSASVWPAEKMPFKIKTDEFTVGQKLLGYDTINLGNSFMDPTFCREVLTYHVLRQYAPAPKSNFVRLWLNGVYWGVYTNTEQVSGEFLGEWFEDTGGNRYKCDPIARGPGVPPSTLVWVDANISSYQQSYELKSSSTGTEWQDLVDMIDVLNNRPASVHWDELAPLLNMDRCLWYLAGQNLFVNRDSYIESGHNYYVYNDPYEGRFSTIPWDTNEAFGNFGMGMSVSQLQSYSPTTNFGDPDYPLLTQLLDSSAGIRGRSAYFAHLRDMLEEQWDWTVIGGLVQQYQALIEQDIIADTKKLYTTQQFYDNVTQDVAIGNRTSCGLQPFVVNRRAYLTGLSDLSAPRPLVTGARISPSAPTAADPVQVLAEISVSGASLDQARLYARSGPATLYSDILLYDDGAHGDGAAGDGTYGAVLPAQPTGTTVEWFILAWTTADTATFEPVAGEEQPFSYSVAPIVVGNGLCLNEFLAKNNSGVVDEAGEFEDWIEVHNGTGALYDLGGAYLSDDLADPTKWRVPAGTQILPGASVLIWADNEPLQGPLHASFKLSADGEEVVLVDADGVTVRDYFSFGAQAADVSSGRLFDGGEPWVSLLQPTPEASNEQSCGYRSYDQLDPAAHGLSLSGTGTPAVGGTVDVTVTGAAAGDSMTLYVSRAPAYLDSLIDAGVGLIDPSQLQLTRSMVADASGSASLSAPILNPALAGLTLYLQAHLPSSTIGEQVSSAVELVICP